MKIKIRNVRIAFCDTLFVAKDYQDNKKFRHSATFLAEVGSESAKQIETAIKAVAEEKWKAKAPIMLESLKFNANKNCYLPGALKADKYDGFEGCMSLSTHRKVEDGVPDIRDIRGQKCGTGVVYSGCYVNAIVDIYAQGAPNEGIRCGLVGVQFLRDGDAFSGSRASDSDFEDLSAGASGEVDDLMG